ncbi:MULTISPECIES: tRNA (cytidine(34)-2'-O)-methyltransferase [Cetobacterium]|uniref:tRNA (cytidine(34)-2'-O)-methyltransferase n=1 Tax=Cetobacterium TaxID=180162 RepID=UPI001F05D72C|nr:MULTISPECIES: tRNA (cytidine(34)-2'-O)-methyltransferase [Cetobacterium]MCX3067822.1 tRNA (cytidine(34)-2'-O)-methyltransferase [Cetobacterium somerae]UPO97882.1 tRNA (cytidine(34)-2'-O)-methyltransferase [Cetobacterium somerae]
MNIVLMEPEIPYNTGNIGRSCVLTNTTLHLIKPLGFSLDEKQIKRSGLDYWELIDLKVWENYEELRAAYPESNFYFATTKTTQKYSDVRYNPNDFIVFGPESRGIPAEIREANKETCITIPMIKMGRSLNLSNSAAIVLYEALRQNNFDLGE